MSVIAIKNRKLAWDSQITVNGGLRWGNMPDKVRKYKFNNHTYFAGGVGILNHIQDFYRFLDTLDNETFEEWCDNPTYRGSNSTTVFFYNPSIDEVWEFSGRGTPVKLNLGNNNYVQGVGAEYAYGVMDAGKSAYEAVSMVIKRFDGCGLPIHKAEYRKRR
jgi:hypothetical protein